MFAIEPYDLIYVDVMKRLRQSDLFKKEGIRQYGLLRQSCSTLAEERFDYLIDWDPEALKEYDFEGNSILHAAADECDIAMALKAGLKYYPEELGFLLRKNSAGDTAYELIVENGDEAWVIIEECLEEIHDEKITEKNAMTNLYPFIVAAAGDTSELNTLYYLLRRSAVVLESFRELDSVGCIEKKRQR